MKKITIFPTFVSRSLYAPPQGHSGGAVSHKSQGNGYGLSAARKIS